MKTPRVTDFDPDAKVPVLKSSLDQMPAIERPKQINHHTPAQPNTWIEEQGENHSSRRTNKSASSSSHSRKRSYVRRSFDFYEDQIRFITQESLRERLAGKEGSMNAMVREAMDDWIRKRTAKK